MRKPLVVVCGLAAVLIAGGIAATTAGADETPGFPPVPSLDIPGMPAFPQQPGDGGSDQDADDQDRPGLTLPGFANPAHAQDDQNAQPGSQDDNADDDSTQGQGAQDNSAQGQGGQGGQGQTPQRPGGQAVAVQQRPAQERPAQRPAAQQPATVLAAAHRDVAPGSFSMSPDAPVQQQVLALVNQNRRRGGCDSLSLDRRLIAAAFGHAADMARHGYFAHESRDGDGSSDRMSGAGYRWSRYGENIARGQDSVYEVVNGWMHSPEHRENIMDCRLEQMGIGLAFAPDRTPYWVQDFATPQ